MKKSIAMMMMMMIPFFECEYMRKKGLSNSHLTKLFWQVS